MRICRVLLLTASAAASAQSAITPVAPNLARFDGLEPNQQITYTRFFLNANAASANSSNQVDLTRPVLTAECFLDAKGKPGFVIYIAFAGLPDPALYLPDLHPKDGSSPPTRRFTNLSLQFVGYAKSKVFKRQFELMQQPAGQLRYNPPGFSSSNLEEFAYFMQFLRSLPTLHVTDGTHTADFNGVPLLTHIHEAPLCAAAGL